MKNKCQHLTETQRNELVQFYKKSNNARMLHSLIKLKKCADVWGCLIVLSTPA